MKIQSWKISVLIVCSVFAGSILGAGFIYQDFQGELDSLEESISENKRTEIIYVNSSDDGFSALFDKIDQSVVYINAGESRKSQGSGFIYSEEGYIVTNHHVVDESDSIVEVGFTDGSTHDAEIVETDPYTDLAVLKVEKERLEPLELGNSTAVNTGDKAIAIGNPFGLRGSMTTGIISQKGRSLPVQEVGLEGFRIRDVLQTDAAINPGNSGGPLLNREGKVIGVNTAIETQTGTFSGIGFAVPSKTVKRVVPELIGEEDAEHPWIGVRGLNVNKEIAEEMNLTSKKGFLVMNVSETGPAEEAGIQPGNRTADIGGLDYNLGGDVIVGIEEKEMRDLEDILNFLSRQAEVGQEVEITVIRDGEEVKIPLTLQDRPNKDREN
ncbi:MAG: trypsin-like peptidase domain-containing protein [Candidatus Nanohaloarchaea archaeon]